MTPGGELPIYVAPQGESKAVIKAVTPATYETPAGTLKARRFSLTFQHPTGPLDVEVTVDERGRFAKADMPAARCVDRPSGSRRRRNTAADVAQPDRQRGRRPGRRLRPGGHADDAAESRAGCGTRPSSWSPDPVPSIATPRSPAFRCSRSWPGSSRNGISSSLRYDKRGVGKSGGRIERVTLEDYAEDAIAVVKWLGKRKDVDTERIFVAGYSEGASVAMLAAAREKKIAGLVLMAGMGTPGRELILEQQKQLLAQTSLSESERADRVALQNKILDAVDRAERLGGHSPRDAGGRGHDRVPQPC